MKATLRATFAIAVFTLLIPAAASAQDGKLNLSFLDRLAERATEKQEVTLGPDLLMSSGAVICFAPAASAFLNVASTSSV